MDYLLPQKMLVRRVPEEGWVGGMEMKEMVYPDPTISGTQWSVGIDAHAW